MKEAEYRRLTYDITLNFAKAVSPDPQMSFVYVSRAGTVSTEKGRIMWARVKGKTENDLMKLLFRQVFAFRPGFMEVTEKRRKVLKIYKYVAWLIPLVRIILPKV